MSSSFFEVFRFLSNLERSRFLGAGRNFRTSIGSFRFTSSRDSEVVLLSQRLALKYNTIRRATLQAFFASFLLFFRFCIHPPVFHLKSVPTLTPVQHACGVLPLQVGGAVTLYNKESIRRPHWANGCSLIYNNSAAGSKLQGLPQGGPELTKAAPAFGRLPVSTNGMVEKTA